MGAALGVAEGDEGTLGPELVPALADDQGVGDIVTAGVGVPLGVGPEPPQATATTATTETTNDERIGRRRMLARLPPNLISPALTR